MYPILIDICRNLQRPPNPDFYQSNYFLFEELLKYLYYPDYNHRLNMTEMFLLSA
jgi:hypothetical protein